MTYALSVPFPFFSSLFGAPSIFQLASSVHSLSLTPAPASAILLMQWPSCQPLLSALQGGLPLPPTPPTSLCHLRGPLSFCPLCLIVPALLRLPIATEPPHPPPSVAADPTGIPLLIAAATPSPSQSASASLPPTCTHTHTHRCACRWHDGMRQGSVGYRPSGWHGPFICMSGVLIGFRCAIDVHLPVRIPFPASAFHAKMLAHVQPSSCFLLFMVTQHCANDELALPCFPCVQCDLCKLLDVSPSSCNRPLQNLLFGPLTLFLFGLKAEQKMVVPFALL